MFLKKQAEPPPVCKHCNNPSRQLWFTIITWDRPVAVRWWEDKCSNAIPPSYWMKNCAAVVQVMSCCNPLPQWVPAQHCEYSLAAGSCSVSSTLSFSSSSSSHSPGPTKIACVGVDLYAAHAVLHRSMSFCVFTGTSNLRYVLYKHALFGSDVRTFKICSMQLHCQGLSHLRPHRHHWQLPYLEIQPLISVHRHWAQSARIC